MQTEPDPDTTTEFATKRVLLVDAVKWSDEHPEEDPLRDVGEWFWRHLAHLEQVELIAATADTPLQWLDEFQPSGVLLSGSPRDAWSDDPVNANLCELVLECARNRIPFLGVCYGHQILGRALGAHVARHPRGWELGNTEIQLTPAGRDFPLFRGFPERFDALNSHADAVLTLPPDCELLATGSHTEVQGFHRDQLLIGVQFHPETDPDVLRYIWHPRRTAWREKMEFDLDQRLDSMKPTRHTGRLFENFVHYFVR